jgi:hypothetical protein
MTALWLTARVEVYVQPTVPSPDGTLLFYSLS